MWWRVFFFSPIRVGQNICPSLLKTEMTPRPISVLLESILSINNSTSSDDLKDECYKIAILNNNEIRIIITCN